MGVRVSYTCIQKWYVSQSVRTAIALATFGLLLVWSYNANSLSSVRFNGENIIQEGLSHREPESLNTKKLCKLALNRKCHKFILNNKKICKKDNNIVSLIAVNSVFENFEKRSRIRKTLGNRTTLPANVRLVFILTEGSNTNKTLSEIDKEHNKYKDTIQPSYHKKHVAVLEKHLLRLKWITEYCQNVELVINIDDDVTSDMYYLLIKILPPLVGKDKTLLCDGVNEPITFQYVDHKWYSNHYEYSNPMDYCVTKSFIMTSDLVPILYENMASSLVTLFTQKAGSDLVCSAHRSLPCLFKKGDESVLNDFWESAHKRRYDFINTAHDTLEVLEGF